MNTRILEHIFTVKVTASLYETQCYKIMSDVDLGRFLKNRIEGKTV